jgi:hypothetical protein
VLSRLSRRATLLIGALAVASSLTCTEASTAPGKSGLRAVVGFSPVFSKAAEEVYRTLAAFDLNVNNVRVVLERENGEIALDTVIAVTPDQDSVVLQVSVELEGTQETLDASIDLRAGTLVLFSGTQTVTVRIGIPAPPPPSVELVFTGPGASATTLDVQPDTTITGTESITMRPVARDANDQPVTELALVWSINNSALGSVTQEGVFVPSGQRGTATITAKLLGGLEGSAQVVIAPPPSALVIVSGGNQTGAAGTPLAQPIVAEVRATDGGGVAGHTVQFAVTAGGGSVAPTSAITDANGRASTTLTLGQTPGTNTISVTATGLPPASVSATATHGAASQLAFVQQPTNTTSQTLISPAVVVEVRDQFGNRVTSGIGATLDIALALSGGAASAVLGPNTAATTQSAVAGRATFNVSVDKTGTGYLLTASGPSVSNVVSAPFDIGVGAAASIGGNGVLTVTDTAGANLTSVPSVTVRDAAGNGVAGVQVKFRRHGGVGSSINAQSDTLVLVATNSGGVASLSARRLQTIVGFDTVLVSAEGLNDTIRFAATVTHASAKLLAFVQQPSNSSSGTTIAPAVTVEMRDQFANRITSGASSTATVSIALLTDGSLGGTTSSAAIAGIATFSDLRVTGAGQHQLGATASGLIAATSSAFTVTTVQGTIRQWLSATTGAWEVAANWSGGVVPGALDTAIINVAGSAIVNISTPVTVQRVVVGTATGSHGLVVSAPSGSLTITDTLHVATSGIVILGGAAGNTVLSGGAVAVNGSLQWSGGVIASGGRIDIAVDASMLLAGDVAKGLTQRTIRNAGVLFLSSLEAGDLTLNDGASIENLAGAEIFLQDDGDILQGTGAAGSMTSAGALNRVSGSNGTVSIGVAFANSDTIRVFQGTLAFTGPSFTNTSAGVITGIGTLDVSGTTFSNAGELSPGFSPGQLTLQGALTQQATSTVVIEIDGTTAGTEYDLLAVSGAVALNGALEVSLGFAPTEGQTFTVLTAGSLSGTFSSITGLNIGGGLQLEPNYTATGLTLTVVSTSAATISWINPSGGNWTTGANWSTGVIPTSSDIVAITLAGTYTVVMDGSATAIAGLELGASSGVQTLTMSSRTFTVNGELTVNPTGVISATSSTLAGFPGNITNTGTITLISSNVSSSVALDNRGLLNTHGLPTISGPLTTTASSIIRIQGQSTGSHANLTVSSGFTNNGLLELTSINGGFSATLTVTSGTLVNAESGTMRTLPGAGGSRTIAAQISNEGLIEADATTTLNKADADHLNFGGSIDLTAANLTVTQTGSTPTFTNNGTVTLGTNRTFTITGGEVNTLGGTIDGQVTSTLSVSNSTISFTPVVVTVPVTLTNTTVLGGAVSVPSGATLTLLDGSVSDAITVEAGGVLLTHGSVSLTGPLTQNGTLRIRGQSNGSHAALTVANSFVNNARIELTSANGGFSATLTVTTGTLTNAEGADIQSLPGAGGGRTLVAQIDNQGLIEVDQPLTINRASANHTSSGTVDLTTANLTVVQSGTTPSFANTGSVTLGANRTLTVTGGTLDLSAGTVSGGLTSTLVVTGSTLLFTTATVTIPMTLTTTTINDPITIPSGETLTLLDGGVTAPVTVQAGGTLLTHGSVSLQTLAMPTATSTLRVQGQSNGSHAALTVAQGFVNNGLIDLTSINGGFAATLTVTTNALTNSGGATIRSSPGAGGSRTLAAEIDNQGLLDVDQPLTLNKADVHHLNTGTIEVLNADLTVTQTVATRTFFNSGTITLGANRDLTFTGGTVDVDGGLITGPASATLIVSNATLAVIPPSVAPPMTLTNVTLSAGSLTIGDGETVTLLNGGLSDPVNIQGGGTLVTLGDVSFTGAMTIASTGLLRIRGQSIGSHAALTISEGFANLGTIELTSADGGFSSTLTVSNGTLQNIGEGSTILSSAGSGGSRTLAAQLSNQGIIAVSQPLTINKASAQHTNVGTIDATNANLTLTQSGTSPSFTNSGGVVLGANRSWTTTGGLLDIVAGGVTGQVSSRLIVTGATLAFTPVNANVPMTLTTTAISGGSVTIGTSAQLTLLNGQLSDPVTVQSGGTLTTLGDVALTGVVDVQSGGVLRVRGQSNGSHATTTVTNGFTNSGLIDLTSADGGFSSTLAVTVGSLVNANGATIRSSQGAGGSRVLAAQLANQGNVDVIHPLTLNKAEAAHVNSNSIAVASTGSLTLTQTSGGSFTNGVTGDVDLGSETWTVSGGTLNANAGFIDGTSSARLVMTGATLSLNLGNFNNEIGLTLNSTSLGGSFVISDGRKLILRDGAVSDAVTVGSGGTLETVGTVALNGAFSVTSGGTLRVKGQSAGGHARLTVANGFTNAGVMQLTSENSSFSSTLAVTSGTLTVADDGVIDVDQGTGGARRIEAHLANGGDLFIDQPLTIDMPSVVHSNLASGNIYVAANVTFAQTGTSPGVMNTGLIELQGAAMTVAAGGSFTNAFGDPSGVVTGTGTLNLSGAAFSNSGEFRPSGTLTLLGAFNQPGPNGVVASELRGSGHDQLIISGAATLGGTLSVTPNDIAFALNDEFTIMTYASRTGTFNGLSLPSLQPGWMWDVLYNPTSLVIKVVIVP